MNTVMSVASKTIVKPPSMETINSCLISLPSLYTSCPSHISILSKPPFKLNLSCSYRTSPLFFLEKERTHFQTKVSALAAQQEEENNATIVLEEETEETFKWENQESFENGEDNDGAIEGFDEEGVVEPPEDAKVFVGNLPYDVDSEKLAHLFEQAGIVEIAEVIFNRETDRSRGFGFVTMSMVEDAEKAVEMFNCYDLNGRLLTVNKAAQRGSRPEHPPRAFEPSYRIYVGNLPWDVNDARLEQVFSEHGKVINTRVVYDRKTGRSRGFGFVTMSSESELNDAIANLDGQALDGRTIRVNVAEERPRRV